MPLRVWMIAAVFTLVVSLVSPLEADGTTTIASLAALHVLVGVIVIAGMRLSTRSECVRRRPPG